MSLRSRRVVVAAVVAVAGGLLAAPAAGSPDAKPYIVVLHDSVAHPSDVAAEHRRDHGAQVTFTYEHALKGYAASLTPRAYGEVMRDRRVAYVEADGVVTTQAEQLNATWGLDRIDTARLVLDKKYVYGSTGDGVTAYVIDTGINTTLDEFEGRARAGFDAFGGNGQDCNGHGTHVAGTIGGKAYGVAKAVKLVGVRVLDCRGSGTWSGVIDGIDWVASDANPVNDEGVTVHRPSVANMSLGGGASEAIDAAVAGMISSGVPTAVAAGNGNQGGKAQDACNYSPARTPSAMTIGATDKTDTKTSWSNYGACVDWFAPGAGITSAWHVDPFVNTISGTSMAAPHVAGVAALYVQSNTTASPETVRNVLYAVTTRCIVKSSSTTNGHLLFSPQGFAGVTAATADAPCSLSGGGGGKPKPFNR